MRVYLEWRTNSIIGSSSIQIQPIPIQCTVISYIKLYYFSSAVHRTASATNTILIHFDAKTTRMRWKLISAEWKWARRTLNRPLFTHYASIRYNHLFIPISFSLSISLVMVTHSRIARNSFQQKISRRKKQIFAFLHLRFTVYATSRQSRFSHVSHLYGIRVEHVESNRICAQSLLHTRAVLNCLTARCIGRVFCGFLNLALCCCGSYSFLAVFLWLAVCVCKPDCLSLFRA